MAGPGRGGRWDSTLSAGAFAAIRSVGFEPVGQVFGAAACYLGAVEGVGCPGVAARRVPRGGPRYGSPGPRPPRCPTKRTGTSEADPSRRSGPWPLISRPPEDPGTRQWRQPRPPRQHRPAGKARTGRRWLSAGRPEVLPASPDPWTDQLLRSWSEIISARAAICPVNCGNSRRCSVNRQRVAPTPQHQLLQAPGQRPVALLHCLEDPAAQPPYLLLVAAPVCTFPGITIKRGQALRSVHRGVLLAHQYRPLRSLRFKGSPAHVSALSGTGTRPVIRPVIRAPSGRRPGHAAPLSCCLSAAGIRFLSTLSRQGLPPPLRSAYRTACAYPRLRGGPWRGLHVPHA